MPATYCFTDDFEPDSEPMEPEIFNWITEVIDSKPGARQSPTVTEAVRLVVVGKKNQADVLQMKKFKKIDASTLSKAVKRYREEFDQRTAGAGLVVMTVMVRPHYKGVITAINVAEINAIRDKSAGKKSE